MEICRKIIVVLSGIAILICSCFLNLIGSISFIKLSFKNLGYALLISTIFLILAYIFGIFKKVIPTLIFNIVGSAGYIYTLAFLNAIPHEIIPKQNMANLTINHYPTIIVTILLSLLAFLNFFEPNNTKKRLGKKAMKKQILERDLTENERIVD